MLHFFFNDTATTEIYTLSLHDALPISAHRAEGRGVPQLRVGHARHLQGDGDRPHLQARDEVLGVDGGAGAHAGRSEEHTSELQSRQYLVCRLLLEKKKQLTI